MSDIYDQTIPGINMVGNCSHCHSDPELFDVNQNQNEIKKFIKKLQECNTFYKKIRDNTNYVIQISYAEYQISVHNNHIERIKKSLKSNCIIS